MADHGRPPDGIRAFSGEQIEGSPQQTAAESPNATSASSYMIVIADDFRVAGVLRRLNDTARSQAPAWLRRNLAAL